MPLSSAGRSSREMAEKSRAARGGVSQDPDNDQTFVMPLIAPQVKESEGCSLPSDSEQQHEGIMQLGE